MARLKLIPLSRAKTAYGLVQDVKRAILSEPKRANMGVIEDTFKPEHGGPACGTVGCFAGWVCLLRGESHSMNAAAPAERILSGRLDPENGDVRFTFEVPKKKPFGTFHFFNSGSGDGCQNTAPSTRSHARAVVARINRFLKLNGPALKRVKLAPVSRGNFDL
jgi:hypothetical protein